MKFKYKEYANGTWSVHMKRHPWSFWQILENGESLRFVASTFWYGESAVQYRFNSKTRAKETLIVWVEKQQRVEEKSLCIGSKVFRV